MGVQNLVGLSLLKSNDITNVKQYIIFTLFIQICCFNNFYVKIYSFYIFCIGFILVLFSSSGSGSRWSPYTFYVTLPSPKKSESLHLWLSRLEEMHRNTVCLVSGPMWTDTVASMLHPWLARCLRGGSDFFGGHMGAFSYIHGQLGIGCRAELYLDSFFDRYRGYHLNWTIFVPTLRHYNKCIYFGSKEKLQ